MDANELSTTVLGLVLEGKLSPHEVPEGALIGQWEQAMKLIKANPEALVSKAEADKLLTQCFIPNDIQMAHTQAGKYNGLGERGVFEWVGAASQATRLYNLAQELDRAAKKAKQNDPLDLIPLYQKIGDLITNKMVGAQDASTIDYSHYCNYMKSGIKWMDEIVGGWPTDGLCVVVAPQKTGKSFWQFYTTCMWLLEHKDKTAAIYTLEMSARHYLSRSLEMYPQFLDLVKSGRLFISGSVRNVDELIAEVTTKKFGWVGIDDMSKLAKETSPERYEKVYSQLNEIARFQEIPVQVLAQPNREAKKANKFIDVYDAAWSGAAENAAAVFITLNKIDPLSKFEDDRFVSPTKDNLMNTPRLYVNYWLFRDRRPDHAQKGDVGAVRLEPGKNGRYSQIWVGEPYKNMFWPPNSRSTMSTRPVEKHVTLDEVGD